jgi:hypothetical protein
MKKKEIDVRKKWVTIRMNEEEFRRFEKFRINSTEKTNSNYLRKLALNKPVTILTRNASMDTLLAELIALRKEINYIGHNFNQAVHKLHTLDRIPEFRVWLETYEHSRQQIAQQLAAAFTLIQQTCSQW